MKILSPLTSGASDTPPEKKEERVTATPVLPVVTPGPLPVAATPAPVPAATPSPAPAAPPAAVTATVPVAPPKAATPRDLKPPVLAEAGPASVEKVGDRLEQELKKQLGMMNRLLAQEIEDLSAQQQKLEEKEGRQVQTALAHIQQNYEAEFKTVQKKFEAERMAWANQLKQREATIEKLSGEIATVKKAVETRPPVQPAAETPVPLPIASLLAPVLAEKSLFEPVPAPTVAVKTAEEIRPEPPPLPSFLETDADFSENKKSGVFAKVWSFLNQTAIEIPLKSSSKE